MTANTLTHEVEKMRTRKNIYRTVPLAAAILLLLPMILACFSGCSKNLLQYTVVEGGMGRMVSKCETGAESIVIPEKYRGLPVVGIARGAFSGCTKLSEVVIPETVKTIESDAFYGCSGLVSITLPAGLTALGEGAFTNCKKLEEIVIPEGVTEIGDATFMGDVSLKKITLSPATTKLGDKVFYNCQALTDVALPEGLAQIGDSVFVDCKSLLEIKFPDSLVTIGVGPMAGTAFAEDEKNTVNGSLICGKWLLDVSGDVEGEYTVPDGVLYVAAFALSGCAKITSVIVPEGVVSVGRSFSSECHALESVRLPSTLKVLTEHAFYKCDELKNVDLGGVAEIGTGSFSGCLMLREITIPAGVKKIEGSAFVSGVGLTAVTFEKTEGWSVRASENTAAGELPAAMLSDPAAAAALLAYDYNAHTWIRK